MFQHRRALIAIVLLASCTRKPEGPPAAGTPINPEPSKAAPVAPAPEKAPAPIPAPEKAPSAEAAVPRAEAAGPGSEPEKRVLKAPEWYEESEKFFVEAQSLFLRGKKEEALEVLEDVLTLAPTHKAALIYKSQILREAGRHAEVIPDLEQALAVRPLDPSLLQELALCELGVGKPKVALERIDEALRGDAPLPGARYIKAVILADMKDTEGALNALLDAVKNGYMDLSTLQAEERFRSLAQDPRFQEATQAMRKFQEAVRAARRPPGQTIPD